MKNPSQCRAGKLGLSLGFVLWTNRNRPTSSTQAECSGGESTELPACQPP